MNPEQIARVNELLQLSLTTLRASRATPENLRQAERSFLAGVLALCFVLDMEVPEEFLFRAVHLSNTL